MSDKKKEEPKKKVSVSQKKLTNIKLITEVREQLTDVSEIFIFVLEPDGQMNYVFSTGNYNMKKNIFAELDIAIRRDEFKHFRKEELESNAKNVIAMQTQAKNKKEMDKKIVIAKN